LQYNCTYRGPGVVIPLFSTYYYLSFYCDTGALYLHMTASVYSHTMNGFMDFIREQGVVGLAIGFIIGGAVSSVVDALVENILNPIIGIALQGGSGLSDWGITLTDTSTLLIGNFVMVLINFLVIMAVVYYGFKGLGLDKLDKEKSEE